MNTAQLTALVRKHPLGFACALISVACLLVIYFRGDLIETAQKEADEQSAFAARALVNITNAAKLSEQLAEAQAFTKELDSRLMRAGQLASNLQYFYKLEAETGVKLIDLRQAALATVKGAKPAYVGVPYSVAVQGSHKQVMQFIARLEAGRHFCRFNSLTFTKLKDATAGEIVSVTINIDLLGTP